MRSPKSRQIIKRVMGEGLKILKYLYSYQTTLSSTYHLRDGHRASMTVAEVSMRRSQRIKAALPQSSQYTSEVSDIDEIISEADEVSSASEDSDEDFGTTSKKRKLNLKSSSKSKKQAKRQRKKQPTTVDEVEGFTENHIFQALSDPEISIPELATNWLEDYESSSSLALKDLLNFVLRCCGSVLQIEEHDVSNNDSAPETIGEIQQLFIDQLFHEYPLLTTNSRWKNFKSNVEEFISQLISIANEKGMLYEDDALFMENLLVWLGSLSTSQLRPLRYCSTIMLLSMQTSLCHITVKVSSVLQKQQKQLNVETNKLDSLNEKLSKVTASRDKSTTKREIEKVSKRIEQIQGNVESSTTEKNMLEDFLKDISNTTFVHRYRDVDPKIRQECMTALGSWIDVYPERFFETSYLRYFGWILSDKDSLVRHEVVKSLLKLYKKLLIVPGFRQFTERFKSRLIDMSIYDSDYNVKFSSLSVLLEITRIGFLEEEELLKVISLIFCDKSNKINLVCSTDTKYTKVRNELSKILAVAQVDSTKEVLETFQSTIINTEESFPLDLNEIVKHKQLYSIVSKAYQFYIENYDKLERDTFVEEKFLNLFISLAHLPGYSHSSVFETLFKYLTFDLSSIDLLDISVKSKLELTSFEKELVLSHMSAILISALGNVTTVETPAAKNKKKTDDSSTTVNDLHLITSKFLSHSSQLLSMFKNSKASLTTFINTLKEILIFSKAEQDSNNKRLVNEICENIVSIFKELNLNADDLSLCDSFEMFFNEIEALFRNNQDQSVSILMDSLLPEIGSELMYDLKSTETTSSKDLGDVAVRKLLILSKSLDISAQLEAVDKDCGKSTLELLCSNYFESGHNRKEFALIVDILKLLSIYVSQLLERLYADKDQKLMSDSFVLSDALGGIESIYTSAQEFIMHDDDKNSKLEVSIFLIDLVLLLKNFQVKCSEKLKILENDEKLADLNSFFDVVVPLRLNSSLQMSLMRQFLEKEFEYSAFIEGELDRNEDEDVNFESTALPDDADEDELLKEKVKRENTLCRFSLKLLKLGEMGLITSTNMKRLSLNAEHLDSVLFKKLFEKRKEGSRTESASTAAVTTDVTTTINSIVTTSQSRDGSEVPDIEMAL